MTFIVDGSLGGTFPSWTTATRPSSPANGQMGYNSTTGNYDMYVSGAWTTNIGSSTGIVLSSQMPTGSVLQVVNATTGNQISSTSTSAWSDTGLTASITPKFSTSKIAVIAVVGTCEMDAAGYGMLQILRGATVLSTIQRVAQGGSGVTNANPVFNYLDSPATTSSTTYKVQMQSGNGQNFITGYGGGNTAGITLMEIAG
jgi:hypothetical protein